MNVCITAAVNINFGVIVSSFPTVCTLRLHEDCNAAELNEGDEGGQRRERERDQERDRERERAIERERDRERERAIERERERESRSS